MEPQASFNAGALTEDDPRDRTEPGGEPHNRVDPGERTETRTAPGDETQARTEPGAGTQTRTDPDLDDGTETRTDPADETDNPTDPGDESALVRAGLVEDGTIARAADAQIAADDLDPPEERYDRTEERLPFALSRRQPVRGGAAAIRAAPPPPPRSNLDAGDTDVVAGLIDPLTGELLQGRSRTPAVPQPRPSAPAVPAADPATAQVPRATAEQLRQTIAAGGEQDSAPDRKDLDLIVDGTESATRHETPSGRAPVDPSQISGMTVVPTEKRRFGRYSLLCRFASGGMADLFLASVTGPGGFEKLVAIKRIHEHLSRSKSFIEMFLDEARLAARIAHPNVIDVLELGMVDDTYFIAMEYVAGQTLRTLTKTTPLPLHVAARIISQAAAGLHAAHELRDARGELLQVVHRDVSPGNILVSYEGAVKVADFGVARARGNLHTTQSGIVKGKFAYMAPEQAGGEGIDRRADIFSLGVILYEITTRRRLFKADTDQVTLAKVIAGEIVPPSKLVPDYPPLLEKIVMRALARLPSHRFQTANRMHEALEAFIYRSGKRVTAMTVSGLMKRIFVSQIEQREEIIRTCRQLDERHLADAAATLSEGPSFTLDGSISYVTRAVKPGKQKFPVWVVVSLGFSLLLFVAALLLALGHFKG